MKSTVEELPAVRRTELLETATLANEKETLLSLKEELLLKAREYNLFSDVLLSVALEDKTVCQYVLRILLEDKTLTVKECHSQYRISKVTSHDAVLDILAEDSEKRLFNIEVQRVSTVNHAKRTRFYSAMLDSEFLMKGRAYSELPETYILYISETDIWKTGRTMVAVRKQLGDTGVTYDDEQHVIYVNAEVDDGSEVAELMKYFKTANPKDMSQGELSKWIYEFKCGEGGKKVMCEITDKIYELGQIEGRISGIAEGKLTGITEGKLEQARKTAYKMHEKGFTDHMIADLLEVSTQKVRQWVMG